jgi:serine protease Do
MRHEVDRNKQTHWMQSKLWFFLFGVLMLGLTFFTEHFRSTESVAQSAPQKVEEKSTPAAAMKLSDPLPANIFIELAKLVNPAVVSIATTQQSMRRPGPGGGPRDPFWDFFEEFMGPQGRQRPEQEEEPDRGAQPIGTGFIIEEDGLIVTNNHVVDATKILKVQLINHPEKLYDAVVVGQDPRTDVALIRIKADKKLPTVKLGSSANTEVGEWVAAFGNPYGHTFSMSKGIISAKGRKIRELNAIPFLQTDASINPGNSGGPLVNLKGEVIGVNSAIDARAQGIGFAIPVDHVKSILPALKKEGKVTYGFIGVVLAPMTPRAIQALKLKSGKGALIAEVQPGGPAERGGMQAYDVITDFNGKKIESAGDLVDAVKDTSIGTVANITFVREGKSKKASITIDSDAKSPVQASLRNQNGPGNGKNAPYELGFKVADWSDRLAKQFRIPQETPRGPIVVDVDQDTQAAQNGLRPGDVIVDVNRIAVKSADDVLKALRQGSNVVRVRSGDRTMIVFMDVE